MTSTCYVKNCQKRTIILLSSIDNVITRNCNVVFATLPSNLFSPIDSHILDFEFFSKNHNFILIEQIIFSYTKIRLHYFNKQLNKNLKGIMYSNFKKTMLGHDNLTDFILYI
jgi:hypothetical protein